MVDLYNYFGKQILFALDAEQAHKASIFALRMGLHPKVDAALDPRLSVNIAGIDFPNPLGMAAGYDKNGDVPQALLQLGFGHTEVGTVTPKAQPGNPKPRIFRLLEDEGVINRLGFNSYGHAAAKANMQKLARFKGVIGINLGANKTSEDFAADYVTGIREFAELATYFTVNISSPNTPGLRALQGVDPLVDLLHRVGDARAEKGEEMGRNVPLFLKIAPDLDDDELDDIAKAIGDSDFDALIVSNTTLSRDGLRAPAKDEVGGLSGKPLFEPSTVILAKMRQRLPSHFPLVGVGGVHDAATTFSKLEAGASLVQLYSGMIYAGPHLPGNILRGLAKRLDEESLDNFSTVIGRAADDWAKGKA